MSIVNDERDGKTSIPEGLASCESPVCDVRFKQSGTVRPRRYCCDGCKMDVWAIRRASKLFEGLSDSEVIVIVRAGD